MKALTDGGYLELVNEFEVAAAVRCSRTRTRRTSSTS